MTAPAGVAGSSAAPAGERDPGQHLFDAGIHGAHVDAFRERIRSLLRREVVPLLAAAEEGRSFPRRAVEALGEAGVLRERWAGGGHGDCGMSAILAEEMGYAGLGGIAVGIGLHLEAVSAILTRFARTEPVCAARDGALDGRLVGCLATSEREAGSDLTSVSTTLARSGEGWRLSGRKWFVSPGAAADFALVLCRTDDPTAPRTGRAAAPMALVLVPREALRAERTLATVGMRALGTARMTVAADVGDDRLVGRPGAALLVVSWGLTHERLAIAAQVLGASRLALALAATHLRRRRQFGVRLFEHQALRLRVADLAARVEVARQGLYSIAASLPLQPEHGMRASAAMKVTAARLASEVMDETMHLLGGTGYLEDETPFARLWRDGRVGRLGGGSDEMMWELVAAGLPSDERAYDELMAIGT